MAEQVVSHPGFRLGAAHAHEHDPTDELMYGFWVFLMSDAIIFGLLFATFAAMVHRTAGGPGPSQVFDLRSVFVETLALLSSSFTFGMASLSLKYQNRRGPLLAWLFVTLALGLVFLSLEVHDFVVMFHQAAGPDRSGFLSSFFGLVPLHGLHVFTGCIWMVVLMVQMAIYGIDKRVRVGLWRLALFWHFLDIVWIAIFSIVYLGGLS